MIYGTMMATEGLPLRRREPGADQDILAGADFLSILMNTSLRRALSETSTAATTTVASDETSTLFLENLIVEYKSKYHHVRPSRSTPSFAQTTTERQFSASDQNYSNNNDVVLAIGVSTSVQKARSQEEHPPIISKNIDNTFIPQTTEYLDQNAVASDEHPSFIAAASKRETGEDVPEPTHTDEDLEFEVSRNYPDSVQILPSQTGSTYDPTARFLNGGLKKNLEQPYHQTLIYHNEPSETGRARSVSYSTVIQALPGMASETDKPMQHDRHERNYNGAQSPYVNNLGSLDNKRIFNDSQGSQPIIHPVPSSWQASHSEHTTEKNWETQEKPYVPSPMPFLPKRYGQPEQSYEVDEAVSVVTNGRAHGVQPSLPPKHENKLKKPDDNQKVGYVVEGRNYRKYRVEERTSDGFIVGEYGVVSHNDGSLRGVRYTADGTINPRLISEALLKFLSL